MVNGEGERLVGMEVGMGREGKEDLFSHRVVLRDLWGWRWRMERGREVGGEGLEVWWLV